MKLVKEVYFPIHEKKYILKDVVVGRDRITGLPVEGDRVAGFYIDTVPVSGFVRFIYDDAEIMFKITRVGEYLLDHERSEVGRIVTNFTDSLKIIYVYLPSKNEY